MRFFSETHKKFVESLIERIKEVYGDDLLSIVIFGSYARGGNKTTSDIDILIVLERAAKSRRERLKEFVEKVEKPLSDLFEKLLEEDIYLDVTPVILTKDEARFFNPLYLSILQSKIIIYDKNNFIQDTLKKVEKLLKEWRTKKENVGSCEVWIVRKGKPLEVTKLG